MGDRRITSSVDDRQTRRLKNIAGLIKQLTYTEMNEFAGLIAQDVNVDLFERVPPGLLKVADRILNNKENSNVQ